ncbi:thiamine phosphate synthase [Flammeovirgaceae bacterium SG7u.111]|nr:thiamine phosphate synthase [Flammeovirgaceae bacterium SG7u.132]WPO36961.1 thiamine phosphate synthase [Flammeovirgaceae bacterium SG7u.111]
MISTVHYISQGADGEMHLGNIKRMLGAGANWIQLRLKDVPKAEVLATAIAAKKLCKNAGATLIVNDFPEVAKKADADGVHLGKSDMSPAEARKILGKNKIIGGTANTIEDCERLLEQQVDYMGVGPFRFTTTKKNLSPILGIEGYQQLMAQVLANPKAVPVIAIGGLLLDDMLGLKECGVHGVAISGMLTNSEKPEEEISRIMELFGSL